VSTKPRALDSLRVRIRRFQFIVGLGFLSLILGLCVLTNALTTRLGPRLDDLPVVLYPFFVAILQNLWALAVLPLLSYGAARILDLKPLSTAVGAVLAGDIFFRAFKFAWGGFEGAFPGVAAMALQISLLAVGVLFSYRAVLKGRAEAAKGAAKAQAEAEARKSEYQEFLREAERAAEKTAQREAERAASAGSAPTDGSAPGPKA
jgi:signal transduction histidine kinase